MVESHFLKFNYDTILSLKIHINNMVINFII